MTTPQTPQTFPISIIANGWFQPHHDFGFAATFNPAPRQSLGLCTYFETTELAPISNEQLETLRSQRRQISSTKMRILATRINKTSELSEFKASQNALAQVEIEYQAHIERAKEAGKAKQFTLFHTHKGGCAFDVDFDTAASIIAFAQQGKIVEIVHGEDGIAPAIHVTNPTIPIHRTVRLPKPALR